MGFRPCGLEIKDLGLGVWGLWFGVYSVGIRG